MLGGGSLGTESMKREDVHIPGGQEVELPCRASLHLSNSDLGTPILHSRSWHHIGIELNSLDG